MNLKRFTLTLVVFLLVLQPIRADEPEDIMKSIKGGDIFEMNKFFASPEMERRLSGTEGYNRAEEWVAAKFKEWGLSPVYGKCFLQPFIINYNEMHENGYPYLQANR